MIDARRFFLNLARTGACAAAVSLAMAGAASAGTSTDSGTWPPGQVPTLVPNIPTPANTQGTTFTGYTGGGPYNYKLYTFTVNQSGTYTATSTTGPSINTTWFLNGTFSPSNTAPTTPLSNFIVGVLAGSAGAGVFTGNFTSVNLVAGQQYTMFVAYNLGSVTGELSTVSITGPGCISLGATSCATPIPTLSQWGTIGMAGLMGLAGVFAVARASRRRVKA